MPSAVQILTPRMKSNGRYARAKGSFCYAVCPLLHLSSAGGVMPFGESRRGRDIWPGINNAAPPFSHLLNHLGPHNPALSHPYDDTSWEIMANVCFSHASQPLFLCCRDDIAPPGALGSMWADVALPDAAVASNCLFFVVFSHFPDALFSPSHVCWLQIIYENWLSHFALCIGAIRWSFWDCL